MPRPRSSRPAAVVRPATPPGAAASWLAGALSLAMYVALTPAVPGDKDSGEFMLVLATSGVAHPTGYPLYTLAGAGFVQAAHALGASWALAANLWSALFAAAAMGGLHAVAARLVRPAVASARAAALVAFLPVLAFGLNPLWTLEATLAEVNAAHLAWVMLAALVARGALAALARDDLSASAATGWAAAWGLVVGIGLAHHLTSVLFAGPLSVALAIAVGRRGSGGTALRLAATALAAALVPVASYAMIAWRAAHPAGEQWPALAAGARGLIEHASGAQYRGFLGRFAPSAEQQVRLAQHVWPWLLAAGVGALATLASRARDPERVWRIALAAGVLAQAGYAFSYGVRDPATYFLPALAIGLALLLAALAAVPAVARGGRALALVAALALIAPAAAGFGVAQARNRAYVELDGLIRRMWTALPAGPAFVVWDDDMASRLRALQQLEGSRPDVEVVQPRHLTHALPRARFIARHGFDPIAGVPPANSEADSRARVEAIAERINAASDRPVVLFLPEIPSLRLLPKE